VLRGPAKTLLQAAIVGGAAALLVNAFRRGHAPEVSCAGVTPEGGELEGVRYKETIRGGNDPSAPMPMVISFHSRGATPGGAASFPGLSGPIRVIRPAGFIRTPGGGYRWFSQPSTGHETIVPEMRDKGAQLARWIGALIQCRPTVGKPVVTGSSEGAHVAYLLGSQYPALVRGAVAVLGYLPPALWSVDMAPTVGLHTTGDATVPFARTEAFWSAMQAAGAPLQTQTFSGGHSVVAPMGAAWRKAVREMVS